jgi:predicted transcriptional regulator of viral defense system
MRKSGILEQLGRGVYRLSDLPAQQDPDLILVALKFPNAVICLISALFFHQLTTEIPHEIYLALPRGTTRPRLKYPPIRVFWFTAFSEGIEQHMIEGIPVRVYSPEKTLVDCFKHRNKIGLAVFLEALKLYKLRGLLNVDELLRMAKISRVFNKIMPYLDAVL